MKTSGKKLSAYLIIQNKNKPSGRSISPTLNASYNLLNKSKAPFLINEKRFGWQTRNTKNTEISGNLSRHSSLGRSTSSNIADLMNNSHDQDRPLTKFCSQKHFENRNSTRVLFPNLDLSFERAKQEGRKIDYSPKFRSSAIGSLSNLIRVTPNIDISLRPKKFNSNDIFNNLRVEQRPKSLTKAVDLSFYNSPHLPAGKATGTGKKREFKDLLESRVLNGSVIRDESYLKNQVTRQILSKKGQIHNKLVYNEGLSALLNEKNRNDKSVKNNYISRAGTKSANGDRQHRGKIYKNNIY